MSLKKSTYIITKGLKGGLQIGIIRNIGVHKETRNISKI
jgi:hypothetical protein